MVELTRLNPYSNGMMIEQITKMESTHFVDVLILILME